VSAANLSSVWVQGGSANGTDSMWVRAFDGHEWGNWDIFTLTTHDDPPMVSVTDHTLNMGQWAQMQNWISYSDGNRLIELCRHPGRPQGHDAIDFADIGFGASSTLGYSANADNSGGTLSVGDDTHMANIALLGSYMSSTFVAGSDGHGGTLVSEVAQNSTQVPMVTQPHA
jgi:hypothetical protein